MRRALFAAALLASALPAQAAGKNDTVALALDEVHTLTFRAPVATVYVGNPAIADITMIDARHAFVLGKTFGRTNIVALNHDGVQVYNARINVAQGGTETLTLNRGVQRVTYNCTGARCEQQPTPGDGKDAFDAINSQLTTHTQDARKAAGGN